jgi:aminopeptidase N
MSFLADALMATSAFLVLMIFAQPVFAAEINKPEYVLSLSFSPGKHTGKLSGTARLDILPNHRLSLVFPEMQVTGALLRDATGRESELLAIQDVLVLPPAETMRTLFISYEKIIAEESDNLISPTGISLNSNWHPLPDQPMFFRLSATLPRNFTAITESERFPLDQRGETVNAVYQKPTKAIHFTAGPYNIHKRQVRENLFVHTMFFPEDDDQAEEYLQAAAAYLNHFEREFGPYPYNHYVIVGNRLPTGYGIATFTLLGQAVLRLPFIKETSLGHEIVHSWFGNSVQVDYSQGNWCEGLTTFLSDYAFREEKGEGVAGRNESITRYLSYVPKHSDITLKSFTSADHTQTMAEAKRAVGYNRGALLFHELREKIGRSAFTEGIRHFYSTYRDHPATWSNLRQSFAKATDIELNTFFNERLEREDIPALAVENVAVASHDIGCILSFTLRQETEKPFTLTVPISIRTLGGEITVSKEIKELSTQLSITLPQRPTEFTIDAEHAFLRQLAPEELPAVWSRFLGAEKRLAILANENDRDLFQPLLDTLSEKGLIITTSGKVTNKELGEYNLIFLGTDQAAARSLFGPPLNTEAGLILDVRRNPLNPEHVAVLVSARDRANTKAIIGRLSHYGKYSYLEFNGSRNACKRVQPVQSGLRIILEELPMGGATSPLSSFAQTVDKLTEAQVVYVGETHTGFADHLLQLRIIEALYKRNPLLAIGMEMFPAASQQALDDYILGGTNMDERRFLKTSDYYQVWRYDYRFFRDILNFAKAKKIPVVGLNLDRHIVSEVFRAGTTDSLSNETIASLPMDRDLDMPGYQERLSEMHEVHAQGKHGSGLAAGFLQAQALWDESMAEKIGGFLRTHPNHTMVILAGTQHTRKDSGIPPRVARRLPVKQLSVVNLYNSNQAPDLDKVADYFFLAEARELPEIPKIGVILDTVEKEGQSFLKISEFSPHGKAAAAGLAEGDRIKEINGMAVADMADLNIAMLDSKKGDIIGVKVTRNDAGGERDLEFQVELTIPPILPLGP